MLSVMPTQEFHPCYYKKHKAYACMPPIGTIVVDPLQAPNVIEEFGKSFLTVAEAAKMDLTKFNKTNGVLDITANKPVLLCGFMETCG